MLSILDTSVLIRDELVEVDGQLGVSAVSIAELQFGVLVTKNPEHRAMRLARLTAILQTFDPLPVNTRIAASYGHLAALTHQSGKKSQARNLDLMIAATAHAHGARLVTANPTDVKHLKSVLEIVAL